jgi:hypothetical protein
MRRVIRWLAHHWWQALAVWVAAAITAGPLIGRWIRDDVTITEGDSDE